jgi:hypothetical protein
LPQIKGWMLFATLTLCSCLMAWFMVNYILTLNVYKASFGETLAADRIEQIAVNYKSWAWVGYLVIPLILLIKLSLISIALITGGIFFEYKLTFRRAFFLALWAEGVFILMEVIRTLVLWFHRDSLSLESMQFLTPLSLINFFKAGSVDKWFLYPLQTINVFEISYWFVLALLIGAELRKPFWKAFEYVLSTYVVSLMIWIVFIVFLTLNTN